MKNSIESYNVSGCYGYEPELIGLIVSVSRRMGLIREKEDGVCSRDGCQREKYSTACSDPRAHAILEGDEEEARGQRDETGAGGSEKEASGFIKI